MATLLKNIYNEQFFNGFTKALGHTIGSFDESRFLAKILDDEWEKRELKQRMRHLSTVLKDFLPGDYKVAVAKLLELTDYLKVNQPDLAFEYMFLPDYVEQYGTDDLETSVKAMEKITQFTSCEFAVRPFIMRYPREMMKQMLIWSKHKNHSVRRFSSEGCRPRLPWAMALPELKNNPTPILPILENLKNDPSEFVRKSVSNNLNDISKDNPDIVIEWAKKRYGAAVNTDKIIKHGCRTLLKQGNSEVMGLFGFGSADKISIEDFQVSTPVVRIGDALEFSFKLLNNNDSDTKIRLEYGLYYQKANGSLSKKVYQISEREYAKHSKTEIRKKQSFRIITTRKFHCGLHQVSVIVNGAEFERFGFELVES